MTPPGFRLDQQSLAPVIPIDTLIKGLGLYHAQKVLDLSITSTGEGLWDLEGAVQGTQRQAYALVVRIHVDSEARLKQWRALCSCPVGGSCKHAAALVLKAAIRSKGASALTPVSAALDPQAAALAAQERERKLADDKVTRWLSAFGLVEASATAAQSLRPTPQGAPRQESYLYLLESQAHDGQRRLALRATVSYRLLKGGWAKPRRLPAYVHAGTPLHDRASATDHDLLRLLRGLSSERSHYGEEPQAPLEGSVGAMALQLALQTGRLFLLDSNNELRPVSLGEPLDLSWSWDSAAAADAADAAASWKLRHQLPSPDATLFANRPPLYLDLRAQRVGPVLAGSIAPEHLVLLLNAPLFPAAAIERHETALLTRLAGVPLPPALASRRVIQGVTPTAHLRITAVAARDVDRLGLLCARAEFDYAGMRGFWPDASAAVLVRAPAASPDASASAEPVLLQRDLAYENSAIAKLIALDLHQSEPGHFYRPGQLSQTAWLHWVDSDGAALRAAGWEFSLDPSLAHWIERGGTVDVALRPPLGRDGRHGDEGNEGDGGNDDADSSASSPWFDLSLGIDIAGVRRNILPWLPDLLAQLTPEAGSNGDAPALPEFIFLPQPDGHFLRLPTATLRPWIGALLDLVGDRAHDFDQDNLRLSKLEALRLGAALGEGVAWDGAAALHDMVAQLQGRSDLPVVPLPPTLKAELRPYQQMGLNWLQFLRQHGLAGILADDMGLGKTVQTLAHIQVEKDAGRLTLPVLIVAPVSLMGNWRREAARFCPDLRTLVLHGQERHAAAENMGAHDVVIAPYSLLHRDRERWLQTQWHLVVLDEAQNIKNASSHAAQVAGQLDARHRLCLSGTPMENHLGEIWSLFHFLMPGFLGSETRFKNLFRTPIEKHGDTERLTQLRNRITPFMLRRTKDLVATELPPKVETVMRAELQGQQADLYETIRLTTEKAVREALADKGLAKSHITVLDALLKLRQVCCDPRLVPLAAAKKVTQSAKLEQLMEILPEMLAEGRRVLLFSQFTSMLSLIEAELKARKLSWVKLTGQSQKRDELIARFTSGEVPLFLISLKAGGVGLNLPQADTVIHYDPWWNPAVETQATDRAHRIGQTKSVWVIKLVAQGTIEERILALQERKAALAESMYSGAQGRKQPLFTEHDLQELLKPLAATTTDP